MPVVERSTTRRAAPSGTHARRRRDASARPRPADRGTRPRGSWWSSRGGGEPLEVVPPSTGHRSRLSSSTSGRCRAARPTSSRSSSPSSSSARGCSRAAAGDVPAEARASSREPGVVVTRRPAVGDARGRCRSERLPSCSCPRSDATSLPARGQLRETLGLRRRERGLLRLRRDRGARTAHGLGARGASTCRSRSSRRPTATSATRSSTTCAASRRTARRWPR